MAARAMFGGLVQDSRGDLVNVRRIGADEVYVVREDGFDWHLEAGKVDAAIWSHMKQMFVEHRDLIPPEALQALTNGDIFQQAAIESALDRVDEIERIEMPPQQRDLLALLGFRVVIDYHGDVLEVVMPDQGFDIDPDEE